METIFAQSNDKIIEQAAQLLKAGNIVAIPTETVYGIAADATNGEAVKKVFEAKGRPQDNPLIVHIAEKDMLMQVVREVSDDAQILMDAFWPGPITFIMPKNHNISDITTAGLDSVGVRMPAHPTARAIIKAAGIPLGAPSANLSGKPSPTSAEDVYTDMNGRLPMIIDGGSSVRGVESTVLSLLNETPILLRPGYITKEDIEDALGRSIEVSPAISQKLKEGEKVLSPGMKYKHYAPQAEITILDGEFDSFVKYVTEHNCDGLYCLCFSGEENRLPTPCIAYGSECEPSEQAQLLFASLRELDKRGAKTVFARCPKTDGISLAVFNRLLRAAGFRVINLR